VTGESTSNTHRHFERRTREEVGMQQARVHTVIIGGGCLGAAAAVATRRRLRRRGDDGAVVLVEKSVLGSGISARHSGIVRAANADGAAAALAVEATRMWRDLERHWGVPLRVEQPGAVWIARADAGGDNPKWRALQASMERAGVAFGRISLAQARDLCSPHVRLDAGEVFYHEPGALQLDPAEVRAALYEAVAVNGVELREKTAVAGFSRAPDGAVSEVLTDAGAIACRHVVNACGPWSPSVFASLGLQIPVSVEPVAVVNWMTSRRELAGPMPIIADYVNLAYFRAWRDGELHMHQPRKRNQRETARAFAESPLAMLGADFVNDPMNQGLGYSQIRLYEEIARRRFDSVDRTVYGSGYRSYFDITPDLKFILGPDPRVPNLVHCLGAGQSFKYAPVFGELVADWIAGEGDPGERAAGFAIDRFDTDYMASFWSQVAGAHHALTADEASL
jgi:glycine/D-amino acid oxidase-like deaminating enzyme